MATDVTQLLIKVNSDQVAKADKRVDKLGKSSNKTTKATNSLGVAFRRFAGPAALVYGIFKGSSAIVKTGSAFETFEKQLLAVTGTTALAAAELDYLTDVANRNALSLRGTIGPYVRVKESMSKLGLEAEDTRALFEGVSNAAATFALSADEVNGVLVAFSQVASKGKVQAEELRNQIGERLPGAFSLAAQSLGVTTEELNKMLETGQVLAKDFLPRFAQLLKENYGNNLADKTDTLAASARRAGTAFDLLKKAIFDLSSETIGEFVSLKGILDATAEKVNMVTGALNFMKDAKQANVFVEIAEDLGKLAMEMEVFGEFKFRDEKLDSLVAKFKDLAGTAEKGELSNFMLALAVGINEQESALSKLNSQIGGSGASNAQKKSLIQIQETLVALRHFEKKLPEIFAEKEGPIDIGTATRDGDEEDPEQSLALERLKKYLNAEWEARDAAFIEEELQLEDKHARDLELLGKSLENKQLKQDEYNDLKKKSEAKLQKDMENLAKKEAMSSQRQQLQGYNQLLGMTGDITAQLQSMAEEGSSAQKALFFASKGISIAQAIINTELAATRAMAEYPAPGNVGMATAIRALGYTSVGLMMGQTISQGSSGNFAEGGIVPGGSFNSDNVTASVNSGEMILNFAQQKQLLDMANGDRRSSGQGVNVNVINNSGSEIEVQEDEGKNGERMIEIIVSKVEKNISSKVQQGGNRLSKSFEGAYGLKRGNS
jgi:tape measure domain-containing protein